jgi:hypothetical protein
VSRHQGSFTFYIAYVSCWWAVFACDEGVTDSLWLLKVIAAKFGINLYLLKLNNPDIYIFTGLLRTENIRQPIFQRPDCKYNSIMTNTHYCISYGVQDRNEDKTLHFSWPLLAAENHETRQTQWHSNITFLQTTLAQWHQHLTFLETMTLTRYVSGCWIRTSLAWNVSWILFQWAAEDPRLRPLGH